MLHNSKDLWIFAAKHSLEDGGSLGNGAMLENELPVEALLKKCSGSGSFDLPEAQNSLGERLNHKQSVPGGMLVPP